jgi:hypothetical protein
MRSKRKIFLFLLVVFIVIQFIQPARNENGQVLPTDITSMTVVSDTVKAILAAACYDCHSNNSRYPWYSYIQPGGWWLARHIKNGKEELNFSEFGSYSKRRQISKLRSIESSITDGTMPLYSYSFMHKSARLTKEEKAMIIDWVGMMQRSLSAK